MEREVRENFDRVDAEIKQIIQAHRAAIARMDRQDERADRAEERAARNEARFEKRMKGFEKLVMIGRKELVSLRRIQAAAAKETTEKMNALIDSQQRTDAKLRAFIDSLNKGRNGR